MLPGAYSRIYACLQPSRLLSCGLPWSKKGGASERREKAHEGTASERGKLPLALRACPGGHRVNLGLDGLAPALKPPLRARHDPAPGSECARSAALIPLSA
ncbi:hypothetical protein THIX_70127 [Thiomonas sp. X19]|nr:hypothetical protein THIX_70127 [Thiomonas sp. X19]